MKKSIWKSLLVLGVIISCLCIRSNVVKAEAEDTSGILQLITTYTFEEKKEVDGKEVSEDYQKEAYGTGFIIVDEESQLQYIISSNSIIDEQYTAKDMKTEVMASGDVRVNLSLMANSEELGITIWKPESNIYGKHILKLNDGKLDADFEENIKLFGFNSERKQCQVMAGIVLCTSTEYGVDFVYHNVEMKKDMCGAPIVNSKNEIIAVATSDKYEKGYPAVGITSVTKVLKALGIGYKSTTDIAKEKKAARDKKRFIIILVASIAGGIILLILIILLATRKRRKAKKEQKIKDFTVTEAPPVFKNNYEIKPDYRQLIEMQNQRSNVDTRPVMNRPVEGDEGTCVLNPSDANNAPIVLIRREKTQEIIKVTNTRFVIGKDPSQTDYCVSGNNAISRAHAIIMKENNKLYIVDKNSKNGTFIDNNRVAPYDRCEIKPGSKIQFADELFVVMLPG